ncbi:GGDEF domain-containing protein [Aliarcobacter butzleri]|uniref:GGDEF domain-containing protein n=1 Tax=Aliarcobacter butzleri TaxID=28197 RepID=UPI001EDBEC95|nr:GGDEF domain-containing protein [Aliarcobacter butzleri]MCG3661792.1 GGDEF domain-containing protein [Aliarcobacter butzleri]
MENIKEITKNTLSELKNQDLETTPENYFIEFKKQADILDVKLDEFKLFDKIKNSLTTDEKSQLKVDSFNKLSSILTKRTTAEELKALIEVFNDILTPSINFDYIENIEDFICEIMKNPKKLTNKNTIFKLKEFANQRIDADRKVLKDKTNDIVKLTSLMSRYFDKTLNDSDSSTDEIVKIKDDLINLNISNSSHRELRVVQKKLIDTIYKIENSIKENNKILSNNIEKFKFLNRQIEELQKELILVKEEQQFDFLTSLLNRRAYQEEVKKVEKQFTIFGSDFAIVFIDIDHFKNINDVYGHACGDAILKNFATILKDLTRKEDIISRYGGEEFVALVNYQSETEIQRYIKRVKTALQNHIFIYKNQQLQIEFSAGVAFRNKYHSFAEAEASADKLLYKAKNKGRNKVIFDDEIEL